MTARIGSALKRLIGLAVLLAALIVPGTAMARDRDHDHMRDRWEHKNGLSTRVANGHRDRDHDGLSNLGEFRAHTDPNDSDTDDDCVADGAEDRDDDGVANSEDDDDNDDGEADDEDGDGEHCQSGDDDSGEHESGDDD